MKWEYLQPVKIIFGNGAIYRLAEEITKLNCCNGLLITSESFEKRGFAEHIKEISNDSINLSYCHVSANPTVTECDKCADILRQNHCDFVVAMGGGSVMDCAKAATTFCMTNNQSTDYLGTGKAIPESHLPLIAVPTTAGTGSEVTCVSVLSDHERGIKAPMNSTGFYPTVAIIDPELTYTVPPHTTACTGFDVLCHAIEAYWSIHHQPICDALAIYAIRLALDNITQVYDNPQDKQARENMAEASVTAGLAFNMPKTTSAHACSYPLTNLLGIAHGEACAMTITHFIRFNADNGCDRIENLARMLTYKDAHQMADAIDAMREHTGMMMNLKSFNLTDEQLEAFIQGSKHPNLLNNPVPVPEEYLRTLYNGLR